eukprot:7213955-Prymnesium_polylepis.1
MLQQLRAPDLGWSQMTAELAKFGNDRNQDKLDWLREQIEMRSIGLSWTEFKGRWFSSKDENTGTVEDLRAHLKTIIGEERELRQSGELPSKTGESQP